MAIYINSIKLTKSKFGIKFKGKLDAIIEDLNNNAKNGWVNLEIKERKENGKYGETHMIVVDEFEPKPKNDLPI